MDHLSGQLKFLSWPTRRPYVTARRFSLGGSLSLSHKLAVAIYKEKLRPRDRVMSSRSKYVQLSVCRRRSARLIITGPPPTLPFNGYVSRIYPPTLTNERVRPLSRRRAQTINIDSIISRIVLTKSYFPVAATDPEGEGRMKSDLSACTPSPFHPPPRRSISFSLFISFAGISCIDICLLFYCASL